MCSFPTFCLINLVIATTSTISKERSIPLIVTVDLIVIWKLPFQRSACKKIRHSLLTNMIACRVDKCDLGWKAQEACVAIIKIKHKLSFD